MGAQTLTDGCSSLMVMASSRNSLARITLAGTAVTVGEATPMRPLALFDACALAAFVLLIVLIAVAMSGA